MFRGLGFLEFSKGPRLGWMNMANYLGSFREDHGVLGRGD